MEQVVLAQDSATTKRDVAGRFIKGAQGNPHGRPPTARSEIGDINSLVERAVRKHFSAERVIKVVEATFQDAFDGTDKERIACRKLIFEYFIQKPKEVENPENQGNSVTIRIENATFKATQEPAVIDGEVTEVTSNG